jgi:hypothetical protein
MLIWMSIAKAQIFMSSNAGCSAKVLGMVWDLLTRPICREARDVQLQASAMRRQHGNDSTPKQAPSIVQLECLAGEGGAVAAINEIPSSAPEVISDYPSLAGSYRGAHALEAEHLRWSEAEPAVATRFSC